MNQQTGGIKKKEQEKIKKCIDENFKTNTGKRIAYNRTPLLLII